MKFLDLSLKTFKKSFRIAGASEIRNKVPFRNLGALLNDDTVKESVAL